MKKLSNTARQANLAASIAHLGEMKAATDFFVEHTSHHWAFTKNNTRDGYQHLVQYYPSTLKYVNSFTGEGGETTVMAFVRYLEEL